MGVTYVSDVISYLNFDQICLLVALFCLCIDVTCMVVFLR